MLLRGRVAVRERHVQCMGPHGLHRIAYTEWGERDNPRLDVEELDAEADRLARWYGALIAVAGACDDVLAERVPA